MATIGNTTNLNDALDDNYEEREFKRGEIYFIDLDDMGYLSNHVAKKTRPALIIQNNVGNTRSTTLIVSLLTTSDKKPYPFQYHVNVNGKPSVVMLEQIMTIDKFRVLSKLGELTYEQMKEVDDRLMYSLQLNRLSLENLQDFNILSVVSKRTRLSVDVYFEIAIHFTNNQDKIVNVSLDKLRKYDNTINKKINFNRLKKILNCCRGLNWLVNNNDI